MRTLYSLTRPALFLAAFAAGCTADNTSRADSGAPRDAAPDSAVPGDGAAADAPVTRDVVALDATTADASCAVIEGRSEVVRLPLDVIVVVDSSPSFDMPRASISSILAPSLIAELERERVDYRVVVVGGAVTAPPATSPPRYFAVETGIGSGMLLASLPGYLRASLPHLRMDSLKAVIDFTDATSDIGDRSGFYTGMNAADLTPYFGTDAARRYTMHTVAGLANNAPSSTPWAPADPVVETACTGFSATPAQELQRISIETGGYRFPLCNFGEYGPFFNAVARLAISSVRVPCEFAQPTTVEGSTPDISYSVMTLADGSGTRTFRPVADAAACGEGYYLVRGTGGARGRVVLCASTCAAAQADPGARVSFAFECPPG